MQDIHVTRQQFLDPGESVVMISMVKKLQKLTSKKVQLILTNKPKLIYVDPSKLMVKGNIIWSDNSDDLSVQVTSPSHFKICTVCLFCQIISLMKSLAAFSFKISVISNLLGYVIKPWTREMQKMHKLFDSRSSKTYAAPCYIALRSSSLYIDFFLIKNPSHRGLFSCLYLFTLSIPHPSAFSHHFPDLIMCSFSRRR